MLSNNAINDFKRIYKQEFDEDITEAEAQEKGERLLHLFSMVYKPMPKDWIKRVLREESIKR